MSHEKRPRLDREHEPEPNRVYGPYTELEALLFEPLDLAHAALRELLEEDERAHAALRELLEQSNGEAAEFSEVEPEGPDAQPREPRADDPHPE